MVVAKGGFVDAFRQAGQESPYRWGTAFIINSDGLAVTNNHVVTGAGYLNVYLPGRDDPIQAKVKGVSECSDLALVDLDGGGYHYLRWEKGKVQTGESVYAAGYPDDPLTSDQAIAYHISDGVVNTNEGDGQTPWSSLDYTIEHSAPTTHGSSGGPLLDESTRVVGVTYSGDGPQSLAIPGDEAQQVIGQVEEGDYESIGVNSEAEGEIPEIELKGDVRVDSVKTGSPADKAGVKGLTYLEDMGHYTQDFITKLEGTDLAVNGTMQEYCNVIRSAGTKAPLSIEVQRVSFTKDGKPIGAVTLTGILNGSKLQQQESEPHSMG